MDALGEREARDWVTRQSRIGALGALEEPASAGGTGLLWLTPVDRSPRSPRGPSQLWYRFPSAAAAEAFRAQIARCAARQCSFRLHYDRRTGELDQRPVVALHMCTRSARYAGTPREHETCASCCGLL